MIFFSSICFSLLTYATPKWWTINWRYSDMQFLYLGFIKQRLKGQKHHCLLNTLCPVFCRGKNQRSHCKSICCSYNGLSFCAFSVTLYSEMLKKKQNTVFISSSENCISVRKSLTDHNFLFLSFFTFSCLSWYRKCESCSGCTREK